MFLEKGQQFMTKVIVYEDNHCIVFYLMSVEKWRRLDKPLKISKKFFNKCSFVKKLMFFLYYN